MKKPSEIINEYLEAFDSREPSSMVKYFCEDGFLIMGNRVWKGHAELLEFFKSLFKTELPPDMEFEIVNCQTENEVTQVVWRGQSSTRNILVGVDTIIVRNEKIQSFTVHIEDEA